MNNTSIDYRKQFILWGTVALMLANCFVAGYVLRHFDMANRIAYFLSLGVLGWVWLTKRENGWGHLIAALAWAIITWAVLGGGLFAIAIIALYIALYIMRNNALFAHTGHHRPHRVHGGWCTRSRAIPTSGVIKAFGRIPFLRIPMPWLKYTLDLDRCMLTRDCLFPGPFDKDAIKKDFFGKDDDMALKQIFGWSFTTGPYRHLSGITCFEFQSKKIGRSGEKEFHWHNMPIKIADPLREKLIDLNK